MASTFYLNLAAAAPVPVLPSGFLAGWTDGTSGASYAGANAKRLDIAVGTSQTSVVLSCTSGHTTGFAQVLSPPLTAQQVAAANWTVGVAAASAGTSWECAVFIALVNGSTGAVRTVIASAASWVGSINRTTLNSELTCYSATISGAAFTALQGDYILVEFGLEESAGSSQNVTFYADGTTGPSSDGAAASNCASYVTCPTTLTLLPIRTLYAHLGQSAVPTTLPSGFLAAWNNTSVFSGYAGASAKRLSSPAGTSQISAQGTATITANWVMGMAQFVSDPLAAQPAIPAGNWTIEFAASVSTTAWSCYVYIALVNGSTGAVRTVISAMGTVGATGRSTSGEYSVYSASVSGATFTPQAGDYLVVEVGLTTSSGTSTTYILYLDGTASAGSDNASTSNEASHIVAPYPGLLFTGVQTLYPRLDEAAGNTTLPSGYLGGWGNTALGAAYAGANAKMLDSSASGAGQTSETLTCPSGSAVAFAQFCSPPLLAQYLPAITWTIGLAFASAGTTWNVYVYIALVNGSTGAVRAQLSSGTPTVGVTNRSTLSTELTAYSTTTTGGATTAVAGDYLVIEVGGQQSPGSSNTMTFYDDGTSMPTSDAAAISSAMCYLSWAYPITLKLGTQSTVNLSDLLTLSELLAPLLAYAALELPPEVESLLAPQAPALGEASAPACYPALSLSGGSGVASVPYNSVLDSLTALAVECWIYLYGYGDGTHGMTIVRRNHTANFGFVLNVNAAGQVVFSLGSQSSWNNAAHTSRLALNTWYYVLGQYDGANITLWLAGKLVATASFPGANTGVDGSAALNIGGIGSDSTSDISFNGLIQGVRVSNLPRASGTFIPPDRVSTDAYTLVLEQLDEGTGTAVNDSSGHCSAGTISGSPAPAWALGHPLASSGQEVLTDTLALVSTLFLHNALAVDSGLPTGPIGPWTSYWANSIGHALTTLAPLAAHGSVAAPTGDLYGLDSQWLSPPLQAGQALGGTYYLAFSTYTVSGDTSQSATICLSVISRAGALQIILFSDVGSAWQTTAGSNGQLYVMQGAIAAAAYTTVAGDRLCLEIGAVHLNGGLSSGTSIGYEGTSPITPGQTVNNAPSSYLLLPINAAWLYSPAPTEAPALVETIGPFPISTALGELGTPADLPATSQPWTGTENLAGQDGALGPMVVSPQEAISLTELLTTIASLPMSELLAALDAVSTGSPYAITIVELITAGDAAAYLQAVTTGEAPSLADLLALLEVAGLIELPGLVESASPAVASAILEQEPATEALSAPQSPASQESPAPLETVGSPQATTGLESPGPVELVSPNQPASPTESATGLDLAQPNESSGPSEQMPVVEQTSTPQISAPVDTPGAVEVLTLAALVAVLEQQSAVDVAAIGATGGAISVLEVLLAVESVTTSVAVAAAEPLTVGESLAAAAALNVTETPAVADLALTTALATPLESMTPREALTFAAALALSDSPALLEQALTTLASAVGEQYSLADAIAIVCALAASDPLAVLDNALASTALGPLHILGRGRYITANILLHAIQANITAQGITANVIVRNVEP